MKIQFGDEELGLGEGDTVQQRTSVNTASTKSLPVLDANEAGSTKQNDTTSLDEKKPFETYQESGSVRSKAVSTENAGGPGRTEAGAKPNHIHTKHLEPQRKFEPIPTCSWEVSIELEHCSNADHLSVRAPARRKSSSATQS